MIWLESVAGLAAGFNESSPSRVLENGDSSQVESFYVNALESSCSKSRLELTRVRVFDSTRYNSAHEWCKINLVIHDSNFEIFKTNIYFTVPVYSSG